MSSIWKNKTPKHNLIQHSMKLKFTYYLYEIDLRMNYKYNLSVCYGFVWDGNKLKKIQYFYCMFIIKKSKFTHCFFDIYTTKHQNTLKKLKKINTLWIIFESIFIFFFQTKWSQFYNFLQLFYSADMILCPFELWQKYKKSIE